MRLQQDKGIQLLRRGANPNADGGRLFCWAIANGQVPLVREFLAHGAKITPAALDSALSSEENSVLLATILLNRGANPNATASHWPHYEDEDGAAETHTMLMVAADEGKLAAVKLLLARGARLNTRLPGGLTALRVAARADNRELCQFFLDRHAQIAGAQSDLLQSAVRHNDLDFLARLQKLGALPHPMKWPYSLDNLSVAMAQKLVALGANPDGNGDDEIGSYPPLWLATLSKNVTLARFLLDKGAHVDANILQSVVPDRLSSRDQQKQMEDAARNDPFADEGAARSKSQKPEDTRLLSLFLERGVNPNLALDRRFERGITALHVAASANRVGAIRLLLEHGANLEARDDRGKTPLIWALEHRSDVAIPVLLDAGADVTARDNEGMTPLLALLHSGSVITIYAPISVAMPPDDPVLLFVQQLVAHGADVCAQDDKGETALHFAAGRGYLQATKFLLEHRAILEAPNMQGRTPLAYACLAGRFATAKLLLESGANPDVCDGKGETPRQIALEPFAIRLEVHGGKLSPSEQKQETVMLESYAVPIREGRRQIAALFSAIPSNSGQSRR